MRRAPCGARVVRELRLGIEIHRVDADALLGRAAGQPVELHVYLGIRIRYIMEYLYL